MRKIILEVPFLYTAKVIAPRKRNPDTHLMKDRIAVEISVADVAEMPIAFRVREFDKNYWDLRWFDGKCWVRKYGSCGETGLQTAVLAGEGTPLAAEQKSTEGGSWRLGRDGFENVQADKVLPGRWISDDRDLRSEAVAAAARECLFCVDGFWEESPQPLWVLDQSSFSSVSLRPCYATKDTLERFPWSPFWSPRELRQARKKGEASAGALPFHCFGDIKVLLPEADTLHIPSAALVSAVRSVLEDEREALHDKPIPFMIAFATLRDAVADWTPFSPALDWQVVAQAQTFLSMIPANGFGPGARVEALESALSLWSRVPDKGRVLASQVIDTSASDAALSP